MLIFRFPRLFLGPSFPEISCWQKIVLSREYTFIYVVQWRMPSQKLKQNNGEGRRGLRYEGQVRDSGGASVGSFNQPNFLGKNFGPAAATLRKEAART